jgi:anti-sigma factor RsiW
MNEPFPEELVSAYLDGELSPDERARVEQWLAASPRHQRLADDLRAVRRELQALPTQSLDAAFSNRVLAAIAERTASAGDASPLLEPAPRVQPASSRSVSSRMPSWRWVAAGAAATLAGVTLLFLAVPPSQRQLSMAPAGDLARTAPPAPSVLSEMDRAEFASSARSESTPTLSAAPAEGLHDQAATATPAIEAALPDGDENAAADAQGFNGPQTAARGAGMSAGAAGPGAAGARFRVAPPATTAEDASPLGQPGSELRPALNRMLTEAAEGGSNEILEVRIEMNDFQAGQALVAQVLSDGDRFFAAPALDSSGKPGVSQLRATVPQARGAARRESAETREPAAEDELPADAPQPETPRANALAATAPAPQGDRVALDAERSAMELVVSLDDARALLLALDHDAEPSRILAYDLVADSELAKQGELQAGEQAGAEVAAANKDSENDESKAGRKSLSRSAGGAALAKRPEQEDAQSKKSKAKQMQQLPAAPPAAAEPAAPPEPLRRDDPSTTQPTDSAKPRAVEVERQLAGDKPDGNDDRGYFAFEARDQNASGGASNARQPSPPVRLRLLFVPNERSTEPPSDAPQKALK